MKVKTKFAAGILPAKTFIDPIAAAKPSFVLLSYHYLIEQYDVSMMLIERYKEVGVSLMLDSGAFQAYKKGVVINLKEYIRFIKAHAGYIGIAVALDDMKSVDKTIANLRTMEESGLRDCVTVLPVYHNGEHISIFDYYQENYDIIGVGKLAYANESVRRRLLSNLFSRLGAGKGLHGFGITHIQLIKDFPFYSVDSASWALWAAYGLLLTDFGAVRCTPDTTTLSDTHIVELSKKRLYMIKDQADRYGIPFAHLPYSNAARMLFNGHAFTEQIEQEHTLTLLKRRSVL